MGYLGTENKDGALYADITPEILGYPTHTMLCHIPIRYGTSTWEKFGKSFTEHAKSVCPVDTGYLRAHIGSGSDEGGVECWSDAPYSAYQEYGTHKMKPQPYFEEALQVAAADIQSSLDATVNHYRMLDTEFNYLMRGCTGGLDECYIYLDRLEKMIPICQKDGYDVSILLSARESVLQRIEQLEALEEARQEEGILEWIIEMIAMMLAELIMNVLTFPFSLMWQETESKHIPIH